MVYFPYPLNVRNAGAELGTADFWSIISGGANFTAVSAADTGVTPFEGSYFFKAPITTSSQTGQTVEIPEELWGYVDGGRCELTLSAMQNGDSADADAGALFARCLDGSFADLASQFLPLSDPAGWQQTSVSMRVPPGTRYVVIEVRCDGVFGLHVGSYWDNFTAEIALLPDTHRLLYGEPAPQTTGWTQVTGTLASKLFHTSMGPYGGFDRVLYWSASAAGEAYRDFAIDAEFLAEVDAGAFGALLYMMQTGDGADTGRAYLQFLDGVGAQIGGTNYTDPAEVAASPRREPKGINVAVPALTRTIRLGIIGTRTDGSDLDAHFSKFSLFLYGDFPEAEARILYASASSLVGFGARLRVLSASVYSLITKLATLRVLSASVYSLVGVKPCGTRRADLWTISRVDGEVLRFTSHDEDVTYGADTYRACHSLRRGASESASDAGAVGNTEIVGIINDAAVSAGDLFAGLYDGATIEAWRVTWDPSIPESPRRLLAGVIGDVKLTEDGWRCELLGQGALLQQTPLMNVYGGQCRWRRVGVPECGVDIDAMAVSGVVDIGLGQRSFVSSALTQEAGYFTYGLVTFTSGLNEGIEAEVRSHEAGGVIELWPRLANPITTYDTFTITPGCDQMAATCKTKFNNFDRFGGFRDVPGEDAIAETPDAKT